MCINLKTHYVIDIAFTCLCLWKLVMHGLLRRNCSLVVVVFPLPYDLLHLEISMSMLTSCGHSNNSL